MSTPRTGGGGGGGASSRRGRTGEMSVMVVETASSSNNNNSNNNDSNNNNNNNSAATTAQKTGGVSRLPSIKERERRPSVQKKARTSSVNDAINDNTPSTSTSITTLQRQESTGNSTTTSTTPTLQRRSSLNQNLGLRASTKPTFAGIGRRVSSMVRARMAFQNRRKSSTANQEEVNHMEHIHEMPRNPRFTTYLSPEAQYAMMKGYEDKLYENITKTIPESRLVMKRTKTPFYKKVSIVDNENTQKGGVGGKSGVGGNSPSATTTTITSTTPAVLSSESEVFETVNDTSGDSYVTRSNNTVAVPNSFRKSGRSHSTLSSDVTKSLTSSSSSSSSMPRTSGSVGFALHRSSSLPSLETGLSRERRLVLTYRLESAMDILDTLKRRNMENSLSPRVFRIPRQVDAVKDFNSWTKVWNKEFKLAHAK